MVLTDTLKTLCIFNGFHIWYSSVTERSPGGIFKQQLLFCCKKVVNKPKTPYFNMEVCVDKYSSTTEVAKCLLFVLP